MFVIVSTQAQLHIDFAWLPVSRIRAAFRANNDLYAPTHLALLEEQKSGQFTLKRKAHPSRFPMPNVADEEIEKEKAWLRGKEQELPPTPEGVAEGEDEDGDIECGCCFSISVFVSLA